MPRRRLVAVEGIEPSSLDYQSSALPLSYTARWSPSLAAATRLELVSTRLQDERSEAIELRRKNGGPGGSQTLTRSLQDFYAVSYITSPINFGGF